MLQWPPPDITPGGPQVNKFEPVSSVGHQMSVAGVGPRSDVYKGVGPRPRSDVQRREGVGPRSDVWRGVGPRSDVLQGGMLPCDLSHDAFYDAYPLPCEQTDGCENITFPNSVCGR